MQIEEQKFNGPPYEELVWFFFNFLNWCSEVATGQFIKRYFANFLHILNFKYDNIQPNVYNLYFRILYQVIDYCCEFRVFSLSTVTVKRRFPKGFGRPARSAISWEKLKLTAWRGITSPQGWEICEMGNQTFW